MAATNPNLFTWQDIEILPDMHRLELVLQYLPDDAIVKALVTKRGCGRNEYPIATMWNAVVAVIVFQHRSNRSTASTAAKQGCITPQEYLISAS